jgi:hypothetical protein
VHSKQGAAQAAPIFVLNRSKRPSSPPFQSVWKEKFQTTLFVFER